MFSWISVEVSHIKHHIFIRDACSNKRTKQVNSKCNKECLPLHCLKNADFAKHMPTLEQHKIFNFNISHSVSDCSSLRFFFYFFIQKRKKNSLFVFCFVFRFCVFISFYTRFHAFENLKRKIRLLLNWCSNSKCKWALIFCWCRQI